jgi:hypothetical protein
MNSNTEKLVGDLKRVVNDAEEILNSTAGEVGEKARETRDTPRIESRPFFEFIRV